VIKVWGEPSAHLNVDDLGISLDGPEMMPKVTLHPMCNLVHMDPKDHLLVLFLPRVAIGDRDWALLWVPVISWFNKMWIGSFDLGWLAWHIGYMEGEGLGFALLI